MIKKYWKTLVITTAITLLPALVGLILWNRLPDPMPSHWNMAGEVDGWSSKTMTVLGMPAFMAAIHWFCVLATGADPKKQNHSEKIMKMIFWLVPLISVVMTSMSYCAALGVNVRVEQIVPVVLGLVFVIIGNYLPKCKQSYTIGIKIPWTLNSEENWNRTHRLAGRVWVVCGLVMMVTAFVGGFWLFMVVTLAMVLVPVLYSYILYRRGI